MGRSRSRISGGDARRGSILLMVSAGMIMLLGMAGLAIDLAALYVARNEAQRAADAAALAGAQEFVNSGYTSGLVPASTAQALATQKAIDAGGQNYVGGQPANILASDVTFDFSNAQNPIIKVLVQRTTARANAMPTFFIKVFGIQSANIGATAMAEAFNPSGTGISVGAKCLKPWLLPNCDWAHPVADTNPDHNPLCPDGLGNYASYFVDTTGAIVNPGPWPSGVIGELLTIKPGDPGASAAPSKFYPVFLPPGSTAAQCPDCATGSGGGGSSSGSLYRFNIACCNSNTITCGTQTIEPITGNMVGPTAQGVDCLIHQSGSSGQDILDMSGSSFVYRAGSNNPLVVAGLIPANSVINTSDSVMTVPIYNGEILCPGASCPSTITVDVVGFLQIFVKEERDPQGTVDVYVLNVAGCASGGGGGGGGGGGTPIVTGGGSPIPVRLIHE